METLDLLDRCYPGRRAELKRSILKTALSLFNEHGIEATTIDTLRVACETSVGAIYHHFGNKDGVVAALFLTAIEDQTRLRDSFLAEATTSREWVHALVYSYVDWVESQPDWARFQYHARHAVTKGPFNEQLVLANKSRHSKLSVWLKDPLHSRELKVLPMELVPSLIIGQAENYCRAWLSGRVKHSPVTYREELAEAAWSSVGLSEVSRATV